MEHHKNFFTDRNGIYRVNALLHTRVSPLSRGWEVICFFISAWRKEKKNLLSVSQVAQRK